MIAFLFQELDNLPIETKEVILGSHAHEEGKELERLCTVVFDWTIY